jgi:hypothetical protein
VRYASVPFYGDWPARTARLTGSTSLTADQADAIRLAAVAAEIGVDALATADPLLLAHRDDRLLARANIRSLEEMVALVGLFLRSRGDYIVWPEFGLTYGRGLFYWGADPRAPPRCVALVQRLRDQRPPSRSGASVGVRRGSLAAG